jgi:2-dehydro-3-deoxyphosphogluconate aldolase/(4S)-4-hydroxy-2-oxoglutarate aldolase
MLDSAIKEELKHQKILPVFNTTDLIADIKRLEIFLSKNSNIKNIEITLRKINSLEIAIELKKRFTNINFGLGSILSRKDYDIGSDEGFCFFVSPGVILDLINTKVKNYITGGETISEFMFLLNNDYKVIKFFPSNLAGGIDKLISIESILKEAMFIPTGGINLNNYMNFISLKNVLCVGMSKFDG